MHKLINKNNIIIFGFLVAEFILWILMIPRFQNLETRHLQYASILLCFFFGLIFCKKHNIINIGLLFTVLADSFLVVLRPQNLEIGMTFFVIVQLCYFIYLFGHEKENIREFHMIFRSILTILGIIVAGFIFKWKLSYLIIVSVIYGINLVLNIVFSFVGKKELLLSIALILFALCDICVFLSAAANLGIIGETSLKILNIFKSISILGFNIDMTWFYYLPSQVLLCLFAIKENNKRVFTENN